MRGSKRLPWILMVIITISIIVISFLPTVPFSSYEESDGNTDVEFPLYGNGRGTVNRIYYDAVTSDQRENAINPPLLAIIYLSWIFQLIGWMVYSFYQSSEGELTNQIQKVFSTKYILTANLVTMVALLWWAIDLNDGNDQRFIKWGYLLVFWIVVISAIINSIIWLKSQNAISSNGDQQPIKAANTPTASTYNDTIKSIDEVKISRKERKEIERKAKEEAKLLAAQEAEILRKQEVEKQMRERIETFKKIVLRSAKLRIEQLATMLEMEQRDLLKWLYDLPEEFGFVINQDIIEFDTVKIGDSIDKLLAGFERTDETKDGKL